MSLTYSDKLFNDWFANISNNFYKNNEVAPYVKTKSGIFTRKELSKLSINNNRVTSILSENKIAHGMNFFVIFTLIQNRYFDSFKLIISFDHDYSFDSHFHFYPYAAVLLKNSVDRESLKSFIEEHWSTELKEKMRGLFVINSGNEVFLIPGDDKDKIYKPINSLEELESDLLAMANEMKRLVDLYVASKNN